MTTSNTVLAQYLHDQLNINKATLGLNSVYYGDQVKIPFTPIACVETGDKRTELNGAPRRVLAIMTNYVLVYCSEVRSTSANRKEDDELAETIESFIHQDPELGGNVIHSLVTAVEFGYQQRSNSLFRAARLTVEARQQEILPSSL